MNLQERIDSSGTAATAAAMGSDETVSILNALIQTCRDGQDGFKDAAGMTGRSDLRSLFQDYSRQRGEFAVVLQRLVESLGGQPETEGTISGALRRGWADLKSVITGGDDRDILNECERGEDRAREAYTDALKQGLSGDAAEIVRQQSQAVQAAHNRIKELRDSAAVAVEGSGEK